MGEDIRKCKSERVMEEGAEAEVTNGSSSKRRKLQSDSDQFENHDVNFSVNLVTPANSITSDSSKDHKASGSIKENISSSDLKAKEFQTEISISINKASSKETSPPREVNGDSQQSEMKSEESEIDYSSQSEKTPPPPSNTRRIISAAEKITPSETELEEFFEAAEKSSGQKQFAEKYNYDIVKDVPMEGKYQWVRLKP